MFLLHLRGKMIHPNTGKIAERGAPVKPANRMNCLYILNELFQWDRLKWIKKKSKKEAGSPNDGGGKNFILKYDYRSGWSHLVIDFLEECRKGLEGKLLIDFHRVLTVWYEKELLEEKLLKSIKEKFSHADDDHKGAPKSVQVAPSLKPSSSVQIQPSSARNHPFTFPNHSDYWPT